MVPGRPSARPDSDPVFSNPALLGCKRPQLPIQHNDALRATKLLRTQHSPRVRFQLQNPLKRQLSPEIYAEGRLGDNSALQGQQYFWDTNRPKGDTTKREGNVISALAGCPETHKEATVAMDKDATTLLCCTSLPFSSIIAFGGGAYM